MPCRPRRRQSPGAPCRPEMRRRRDAGTTSCRSGSRAAWLGRYPSRAENRAGPAPAPRARSRAHPRNIAPGRQCSRAKARRGPHPGRVCRWSAGVRRRGHDPAGGSWHTRACRRRITRGRRTGSGPGRSAAACSPRDAAATTCVCRRRPGPAASRRTDTGRAARRCPRPPSRNSAGNARSMRRVRGCGRLRNPRNGERRTSSSDEQAQPAGGAARSCSRTRRHFAAPCACTNATTSSRSVAPGSVFAIMAICLP